MLESVIQVDGLLTALCARNVEKALLKVPGVHHVDANCLNSTATVHYDEALVTLAAVAGCRGRLRLRLRGRSAARSHGARPTRAIGAIDGSLNAHRPRRAAG